MDLAPRAAAVDLEAERGDLSLDQSGSTLWWDHGLLRRERTDEWFRDLSESLTWKQGRVLVFGKWHDERRLTCAFGDGDISYSGRTVRALPWEAAPAMVQMKKDVEEATGCEFDAALLNLYRDGGDSIGWHSDDEAGAYRRGTPIASVSLGAPRDFAIRAKGVAAAPILRRTHNNIPLRHGTLLVMGGSMQDNWDHSVPARKRCKGARICVTFRCLGPARAPPRRERSRSPRGAPTAEALAL